MISSWQTQMAFRSVQTHQHGLLSDIIVVNTHHISCILIKALCPCNAKMIDTVAIHTPYACQFGPRGIAFPCLCRLHAHARWPQEAGVAAAELNAPVLGRLGSCRCRCTHIHIHVHIHIDVQCTMYICIYSYLYIYT